MASVSPTLIVFLLVPGINNHKEPRGGGGWSTDTTTPPKDIPGNLFDFSVDNKLWKRCGCVYVCGGKGCKQAETEEREATVIFSCVVFFM